MKNKAVKQMIIREIVKNTNCVCAWWSEEILCGQFPSDDEYCNYDDLRIYQRSISLTAEELKNGK